MRTVALISALVAAVSAERAHEFFAENNYICELCKNVVELARDGKDSDLDALYEQFPKLQDRVNWYADKPELVNLSEPEQSCKNI